MLPTKQKTLERHALLLSNIITLHFCCLAGDRDIYK